MHFAKPLFHSPKDDTSPALMQSLQNARCVKNELIFMIKVTTGQYCAGSTETGMLAKQSQKIIILWIIHFSQSPMLYFLSKRIQPQAILWPQYWAILGVFNSWRVAATKGLPGRISRISKISKISRISSSYRGRDCRKWGNGSRSFSLPQYLYCLAKQVTWMQQQRFLPIR